MKQKEIIISGMPMEYYKPILFDLKEDIIKIFAKKNDINHYNKALRLVLGMQYLGFYLKKKELKKTIKKMNGEIITDVIIFTLNRNTIQKNIGKKLKKDRASKDIEKLTFKDDGRLIFIKKEILFQLIKRRHEQNEDYNQVFERILNGNNQT